jgi:hypothetical protein
MSRDKKWRRYAHESTGKSVICRECFGTGTMNTSQYVGRCLHCDGMGWGVIPSQLSSDKRTEK